MKKRQKLGSSVAMLVIISMAISVCAMTVSAVVFTKSTLTESSVEMLAKNAESNAKTVEEILCEGRAGTAALSDAISGFTYIEESRREKFINNSLERYMFRESELGTALSGVFCEFEPHTITPDNEGFTSYFYVEEGEMWHETATPEDPADYTAEDYYIATKNTNSFTVSEPYVYDFDNGETALMITVASPINDKNGKFIGLVGFDILLDSISEKLSASENFESSYSYILSADKICSAHSDGENLCEVLKAPNVRAEQFENAEIYYGKSEKVGGNSYIAAKSIYVDGVDTGWVSYVNVSVADITEFANILGIVIVFLGLVVTVVLSFIVTLTLKKKLAPVNEVVEALERLEEGDLNAEVTVRTNDEIGLIAEKLNMLSSSLREYVSEIKYIIGGISGGNLTVKTSDIYRGDFIEIKRSLETITESISTSMRNISESSNTIRNDISQVSFNSNMLATNSESEVADADKLVVIVEELTGITNNNADNAREIDRLSNNSKETVENGNQHMSELCDAMLKISSDSEEIASIVKTIDDIAFQTNILALNASVEAARAGTFGKGFSVVADEVSNLAKRSAEASSLTAKLVANSQKNVADGVELAKSTAKRMDEIAGEIQRVVEIAGEINTAAETQSRSIETVSNFIVKINGNLQNNVAASEESAASIRNLMDQTKNLDDIINEYKLSD